MVIVNHRTPALTLDAVRSVLGEPEVSEVVVMDNGSADGSAGVLHAGLDDHRTRLIESPANVGFGQGVNLAAGHASAPLLFILNSDATVVPGSLGVLAAALLADRSIGVVAPAVHRDGGHALQADALGRFPRPVGTWHYDEPALVTHPDWVSGVAMLLRREDFAAVGGFDATFTMYLEDVDLCRRLRERGLVARREPAAAVIHLGGRSWGSGRWATTAKKAAFHDSKMAYFRRAGTPPAQLAYLRAVRTVWHLAARLSRSTG